MNKKNKIITIGLATVALISILIATYLYCRNRRNNEKIAELEEDKLKLILDSLKQNHTLSDEVKNQLEKLIEEFSDLDEKVSNELAQALQLFQIGQVENAIEDLVKIIEHLLNVHYKDNKGFCAWLKEQKKRHDLHNLLTYCKVENKISDIEFQFFVAIKTIRNKEDHTLDLKLDDYLNASGLITAIGGIFKMAAIVYPQKKLGYRA